MRKVTVFPTPVAIAEAAALRFVERVNTLVAAQGRCAVALSGGSTPKVLYGLLASPPWFSQVPWDSLHLFLADERFVPFDHPDSTVRLLRETLLVPGQLPESNLHVPDCEGADLDAAASGYAAMLEGFFAGPPALDIALLGMGPDGHTASLFPGRVEAALDYPGWTAAVRESPKPPPERITLTLGAINRSAEAWFLVTGADKAGPVAEVFGGTSELPAARVMAQGETFWWVDGAAGADLGLS